MPHPFDATTKHLVEDRLADWLPLSSRPADGPVRVIDSDLATVTAAADRVLRVEGPTPWLLHLELHTYRDPTLPSRLNMYGGILEHRHEALVWQVAVLLRREADHDGLTGRLERRFGTEEAYRTFRYQVVRVWELPAERLLTGGLGILPLSVLTDEAVAAPEGVVRRIRLRLDSEATPPEAADLWAATKVLMGLRYEAALAQRLLEGVQNMRASVTYQAILREGAIEYGQKTLRRQGERRFGPPPPEAVAALDAITDLDRLDRLLDRVSEVQSWGELLRSEGEANA
jgi:predicted transposase YdaD